MGKSKMKFPFLFKSTSETTTAAAAWPWPTCVNSPRTHSFRANPAATAANIYKTLNSAFLDDDLKNTAAEISSDSYFSLRREESFSSASEIIPHPPSAADESAVFLGLRSDRLFFEPGETNSILEEAKSYGDFPYKQGAALLALDSRDPFLDFRVSMEEMVEAHGLKDWDQLEELLTCYLRVNRKSNHGFIVGAFVDLLLGLAVANDDNSPSSSSAVDEQCSSATTHLSFTSPLSFSSSTCSSVSPSLSLLENEEDEIMVVRGAP